MTIEQLTRLVARGESDHLEFKKSTGDLKGGLETLCALLNGEGGRVVFGVTKAGKIVGQDVADATLQDVARELRRLEPAAKISQTRLVLDSGREVLVLATGDCDQAPYTYNGRAYWRIGNTTSLMPQVEYQRRLLDRAHPQHRWENQVAGRYRLKQLDLKEVRRSVADATAAGRLESAVTSPVEALEKLKLIDNGRPLQAAVVAFAKEVLPDYPQCGLRMARFRGTTKTEFLDQRQLNGHAFLLLREADLFLRRHLPVAGRFEPGLFERQDEPLFPPLALREALVNALCHRDYSIPGGAVNVAIFDDRLEISSTGILPSGLTLADLKRNHQSLPRNPLLANIFYLRGLIERWGRGTQKIVELCVRAGHPEPEFEERASEFVVRFIPTSPKTRLVASVRFPTNLQRLANIATKFPGRVWIHTGYKEPHEVAAERGQFHSKLLVADLEGDERLVIVGSHNWTQNALCGHNLEAGVVLRCRELDDAVQSARQHIEACIAESQPFDPGDLRFYETVQRKLHSSPSPLDTEPFPGFEPLQSLVIHAEDATGGKLPAPLRLFVPVRAQRAIPFFPDGRRVHLFLYPQGTLHDQQKPTAAPVLFDGKVTMINEVDDAPVGQRLADCELTDLRCPLVKPLPGNVPAPSNESRQLIIRLGRVGEERVPIYHSDPAAPNLKLDVSYKTIDLNELFDERRRPVQPSAARDSEGERRPPRRVTVPNRLLVAATVCVASRELCDFDIEKLLNFGLHGSEFVNQEDVAEVHIKKAPKKEVLSHYIYGVYYRFSKEVAERAEAQMPLF